MRTELCLNLETVRTKYKVISLVRDIKDEGSKRDLTRYSGIFE